MSFNHLDKYELASEPVPYTLYQLGGAPKLFMKPAGEKNKGYHDALLKRNAKLAQQFRAGTKVTRAMLQENRHHDKALYGKHVIVGWEGIVDDADAEVAFTPEVCKQFLAKLPNWIFDDVRQFATNPANFLKEDEPDDNDAKALAGN